MRGATVQDSFREIVKAGHVALLNQGVSGNISWNVLAGGSGDGVPYLQFHHPWFRSSVSHVLGVYVCLGYLMNHSSRRIGKCPPDSLSAFLSSTAESEQALIEDELRSSLMYFDNVLVNISDFHLLCLHLIFGIGDRVRPFATRHIGRWSLPSFVVYP